MAGMTTVEQRRLIRLYLGVSKGYLADFSTINDLEAFYVQCRLDVNPREIDATNRERFEQILAEVTPAEQAAIIREALKQYPPDEAVLTTRNTELHDELLALASRLEGMSPVRSKKPAITSAVVERAIDDAEQLLEKTGATSAVDRLHTVLHGYLRAVCDDARISYGDNTRMSGLFGLIRSQHPAFADFGPRRDEILHVLRSMSGIMDLLNPIRNESSMAHPNKDLLDPPEAVLVINTARTILHYLDMKLSAERFSHAVSRPYS
jgi:hypothetical protein